VIFSYKILLLSHNSHKSRTVIFTKPKSEFQYVYLQLRLSNDKQKHGEVSSGFLQTSSEEDDSERWLDVCSDEWNEKNAIVACKNLGYPNVKVGITFRLR